jgi:hypothetical protein
MTQLCTLAQVHAMLHFGASDTGDDSLISDVLIPAASEMIENEVQYTFGTLHGSLKLFAAPPYLLDNTLYFRDNVFTQVDAVTTDGGTLTPVTDYTVLPLNFTPKTRLLLTNFPAVSINNPAGTLTVSGTLGYGSIPSDVNFAATKLAAWMYQTRDSDGNIQVVEGVTNVPAEAPPLVLRILAKYRHNLIFA